MANGTTVTINTQNEYVTIESVAVNDDFTGFTLGKKYNMYAQGLSYIKIGAAVFPVCNRNFNFTMGEDDPYIKTYQGNCLLTILEVYENA